MVKGYVCTERDVVTKLTVTGDVVSGYFVAHEAYHGVQTEQTFKFKYVVLNGAIRKAELIILAGTKPPGCP